MTLVGIRFLAPRGREVLGIATVVEMHNERNAGFVEAGPEGVEIGMTGRSAVDGPALDHHRAGAEVQHTLQFEHRFVHIE